MIPLPIDKERRRRAEDPIGAFDGAVQVEDNGKDELGLFGEFRDGGAAVFDRDAEHAVAVALLWPQAR